MHIQIIQFQLSGQRPHRRRRPATAGLRGAASLLRLAESALRERPDLNFEERTIPHVVEALTRTYLADVRPWGADYDGGSNVVVRGLRAKLGERAAMIETLRGRGYRIRSD